MSLRIRLMGRPALVRDGAPAEMQGRKTWALLAYLLLEPLGATRRELVARLWSEAEDPQAAARWTLSQVRKALAPEAAIVERSGRLILEAAERVSVDINDLLEGRADAAAIELLAHGELLEDCDLDDSPEFSRWLTVQRARVASAVRDGLRWSASLLARHEPERALASAERVLLTDPYDEATHELIVEIHAARGDRTRAAEHVARATALFRNDLGIDLPKTVLRPLERPTPKMGAPLLLIDVQARALLETAQARGTAGDYAGAREISIRAAREAAANGDTALEVRAILLGVRSFTAGGIGTAREWGGQLQRALRLASDLGDPRLIADVEIERGRIAAMDGSYGAAEASLHRAEKLAAGTGDPGSAAWARAMIGVCRFERGDLEAAEADLRSAAAVIPVPYVLASQARALLGLGRRTDARVLADQAVAVAETHSRIGPLQWALIAAAEVRLAEGDLDAAEHLAGRLLTISRETRAPSMQAMGLRILAQLAMARADPARAAELLREAVEVAKTESHRWIVATVMADLERIERHSQTPAHTLAT